MSSKGSAPAKAGDDLWPVLIEFVLSQKSWWISLCAEQDLSPAQGHAMRALDPDRPVAMSTLADAMVCDASNVTGIVDKLESRGLIARQSAGHDRRIKMLVVTDRGRELRQRLFARVLEAPAAVAAMPADARRRLSQVLKAILEERGGAPVLFR